MSRMRTFFLYLLGILGFMLLSFILEDGLIRGMYKTMNGNVQISENASSSVSVEPLDGKASNVNGNLKFRLTNNSDEAIKDQYVKIDLYNERRNAFSNKIC